MKKILIIILSFVLVLSLSLVSISANTSEMISVLRNSVKLEVNGVKANVDNFLYNGTTYIPLRDVSQILDKNVGWNKFSNIASINEQVYEVDTLSKLIPNSKGIKWSYDGFAEYSHVMTLDNIIDKEDSKEYIISGEVGDPSDGEGNSDLSLNIKYTISDNKLVQEKTESAMLDSKYDKITLIQTPLIAGTQWSEELVDKKGKKATMNSFIQKVEISEEGNKQYTIKYEDTTSEYYETRVIEEGKGIVEFEKLLEFEDSSFSVIYFLFKTEN